MVESENRQADADYRGVVLPAGMSRACLDNLARIINRHQLESCEETDAECAVRVFEAVQRHSR